MERTLFDYSKLRGRIVEKYGTMKAFAEAIHMSTPSLTQKIRGKQYFSQSQIMEISNILDINPDEIYVYFFTNRVQKCEQ